MAGALLAVVLVVGEGAEGSGQLGGDGPDGDRLAALPAASTGRRSGGGSVGG